MTERELEALFEAEFEGTPIPPPFTGQPMIPALQQVLTLIRYLKEQLRDKEEKIPT